MPYFKWTGVDITGAYHTGKNPAHSPDDLSLQLLERGISLCSYKSTYILPYIHAITADKKAALFSSLSQLMHAGIMIPELFLMVAKQVDNPLVYETLFCWAEDIKNGRSYIDTIKKDTYLCDYITQTMLIVGYESNSLPSTMENVSQYYLLQHQYHTTVKKSLAGPAMTFAFFIASTLLICAGILPRFIEIFSSVNIELPAATRHLIAVSCFIVSTHGAYSVLLCTGLYLAVRYYYPRLTTHIVNATINKIPYIAAHIQSYHWGQAFFSLALLMKSNVTLLEALNITALSSDNAHVKKYLHEIIADVKQGKLLSQAMRTTFIFPREVITIISIAEESGTMAQSLKSAANLYMQSVYQFLNRAILIIQPMLIMLLGCLIALLIFSVYTPIMNLSYAIK